MALLYAHPFSRMATADLTLGPTPAMSTISLMTVQTGTVPAGSGYGLGFSSSAGYGYFSGLGNQGGLALGFHLQVGTLSGINGIAFATLGNNSPVLGGGGAVHVALCLNGDGSLQVYRGRNIATANPSALGTSLGSASSLQLSTGQFYYIELVATFSNTVGVVEVWVNGVRWINLTGLDTVDGGTTTGNTFGLAACQTTQTYMGNVYVTSPSGGSRTGRQGPLKITTYAAAVDGVNQDFTLSTGSDAAALVDDTTPNGDTDHIESTAPGDLASFTPATVSASGQILGAQVRVNLKKTDAAALTSRSVLRIGGTDYMGTSRAPLETYGYQSELYEVSPASAVDFSATELNGAEIGLEHES